jgi:hypothetical protein
MRCWVKKNPAKVLDPDSYQAKILAIEPKLDVSFASACGVMSKAKAERKPRFVKNPENWGPRPRHGRPMLMHEREEVAKDRAAEKEEMKEDNWGQTGMSQEGGARQCEVAAERSGAAKKHKTQ